jgi:hypothetical protein
MSITLNDNFRSEFPKPLDERYGSYTTIQDALNNLPSYKRYKGLTALVGSDEYWFKDGILDGDFVAKIPTISYPVTSVNGQTGAVVLNKSDVGLSNVANVDTTNASNISSGTLADARLTSAVTLQGNTFNGANQLVKLDASAKLPAVDGSDLTNLPIPPSTGGNLYLFYNY